MARCLLPHPNSRDVGHPAGKTLVFCGARDQPRKLLSRTEFLKRVGTENFLPHVQAALARAREIGGEFEGVGEEMAVDMEEHPL